MSAYAYALPMDPKFDFAKDAIKFSRVFVCDACAVPVRGSLAEQRKLPDGWTEVERAVHACAQAACRHALTINPLPIVLDVKQHDALHAEHVRALRDAGLHDSGFVRLRVEGKQLRCWRCAHCGEEAPLGAPGTDFVVERSAFYQAHRHEDAL